MPLSHMDLTLTSKTTLHSLRTNYQVPSAHHSSLFTHHSPPRPLLTTTPAPVRSQGYPGFVGYNTISVPADQLYIAGVQFTEVSGITYLPNILHKCDRFDLSPRTNGKSKCSETRPMGAGRREIEAIAPLRATKSPA